ncbi:hypothetical protein IscW_ISCW010174, partial [Ixodes scapularis]
HGVKGLSALLLLSFFKFPSFFVVDYMQAVCSGFVKYTACMWFDSKTAFPFSLGGKIAQVDSRLLSLKTIQEMSRLPRSVMHRKYWKSSEWRNWLFFFFSGCAQRTPSVRVLQKLHEVRAFDAFFFVGI